MYHQEQRVHNCTPKSAGLFQNFPPGVTSTCMKWGGGERGRGGWGEARGVEVGDWGWRC